MKQSGFAAAVHADQTVAVSIRQLERRVVDEVASKHAHVEIDDLYVAAVRTGRQRAGQLGVLKHVRSRNDLVGIRFCVGLVLLRALAGLARLGRGRGRPGTLFGNTGFGGRRLGLGGLASGRLLLLLGHSLGGHGWLDRKTKIVGQ